MKTVSILLISIVIVLTLGSLKTHEIMELSLFLTLLILLFTLTICITRHIQRYLIMNEIEKDFENIFTEEFYNRLKETILKNEFKQVPNDELCPRQAQN